MDIVKQTRNSWGLYTVSVCYYQLVAKMCGLVTSWLLD